MGQILNIENRPKSVQNVDRNIYVISKKAIIAKYPNLKVDINILKKMLTKKNERKWNNLPFHYLFTALTQLL